MAERFHYDHSDDEIDGISDRAYDLTASTDEVHVVFTTHATLHYGPLHGCADAWGRATRRPLPIRLKQGGLF